MKLQKALSVVDRIETLTLVILVDSEYRRNLEKKHKQGLHDILYGTLEAKFKVERVGSMGSGMNDRDQRVVREKRHANK